MLTSEHLGGEEEVVTGDVHISPSPGRVARTRDEDWVWFGFVLVGRRVQLMSRV